jgi:DNA-binding NarL/FixJ family response regulator
MNLCGGALEFEFSLWRDPFHAPGVAMLLDSVSSSVSFSPMPFCASPLIYKFFEAVKIIYQVKHLQDCRLGGQSINRIENLMNDVSHRVRVLLADDHPLVRAGIRAVLEALLVEVVGEAGNGREVLDLVRTHRPDVVLMDISMPGLNGLEAAARMADEFPDVRVLILSMHDNEEYYWRALKVGAAGYLLKTEATEELETALRRVVEGEIYLSPEISARLLKKFPLQGIADHQSPLERLTGRQREVLQLMAEGQSTKAIANILQLSPKTVEYHRMKLMDCLDVHDVPGLVRFALRVGLISQER